MQTTESYQESISDSQKRGRFGEGGEGVQLEDTDQILEILEF